MNKTDLNAKIEEAKRAEESENFFNATAFYKEALEEAIKAQDSKLIKFYKNYALIKILVSVEVALQGIIDEAMDSCDAIEKFLRFHFYATNVQKPTKKVIKDYLDEIAEKKAN